FVCAFLSFLMDQRPSARLRGVYAFADLRGQRPDGRTDLLGFKVLTPYSTATIAPPRVRPPSSTDKVRAAIETKESQLANPSQTPKPLILTTLLVGNTAEAPLHIFRYPSIELSSEFWQNVAELGIISATRTGRENRNILFYENNERFLASPRMR